MKPTIVIGVGHEFRRDEAVGLEVVERLRGMSLREVAFATCDGEPTHLIELWSRASTAVVVGTVRALPTGRRIRRISAQHPAATPQAVACTHGAGLGDAVSLGRALDLMPRRLLLYAVEVADTDFGIGVSPDAAAAVPELVDEVAAMVDTSLSPETWG